MKRSFIIIISIAILALVAGIVYVKISDNPDNPYEEMTLKNAAKIGEVTTHKLLIQIEESGSEDRYERGDVVLTASSTREFSLAEKEGFLIIKMDLTPAQAEVMTGSLYGQSQENDSDGNTIRETVKRRKHAVDLEKIGIPADDYRGRELNEIYKWDILFEKNL